MNQRGRKSSAALAVVDDELTGLSPLMPPRTLTVGERTVWMATVNSKPADHFGSEHVPILVEYVRHVCKADVIDAQIKAFEPDWLATDDGLKRYEKLIKLGTATSGVIKALATSMRLTQHAVYLKDKASLGRKVKDGKIWQREQLSQS